MRLVKSLLLSVIVILIALPLHVSAQAVDAKLDPVAHERATKGWEYGPFVNGGNGLGQRSNYKFFWAGVQVGKPVTRVLKAGIFSGQFELGGEVIPFFQAYTPAPYVLYNVTYTGYFYPVLPVGGGDFTGMSVAPVIFRWNFATHTKRFAPWAQAKGAVLYTTHKFPPDEEVPEGRPGRTSVWNFMPQGGIGFHYFTRPNRSIDVAVNAVHISSASLGDHNPGVNASLQLQLGYTFWKK